MYSQSDIDTLTSSSRSSSPFVVIKDHAFDDIVEQIVTEVDSLKSQLRPAKMGRGADQLEDEILRGDSLCWITPAVCENLSLRALDQFVKRLISENQALKSSFGLSDDYNVQFAMYPGKAEGYNRHKDAFPQSASSTAATAGRQLTCLLYLNKDWKSEHGGQLRVFSLPGVTIEGEGCEPFNFWGVNGVDINPSFGRLVVFRSEIVEHAVLPCHKERIALTFWAHGTGGTAPNPSSAQKSVFKFTPDAPKSVTSADLSDSDSSSSSSDD